LAVQDAQVIAMLDYNPRAKKHVLVIPHEHIPSIDDLTPAHYELRT
jgi:diadenosine tetraphosphate (Ap4A) HIT family hydrolase